jgi:Ca-activated chloride channel family protein
MPPVAPGTSKPLLREIVFVIDNSGSMGGTSIIQAKESLRRALRRLKPDDRFNVVRFDDTFDVLFPDTVPADPQQLATADRFVAALDANGGTEMVPAMQAALADPRPADRTFLRQVVFLTDGAIGDEARLFATIERSKGRSRLFMVGIGSAPNTYLMTEAAERGRGTYTHIGSEAQVEERMRGLFEKLESPAVTSLGIDLPDAAADVTPSPLPDLYRGEPLVIAMRASSLAGSMKVRGRIGETPWEASVALAKAAPGSGISKLWARRKIDDEEAAIVTVGRPAEEIDKRILAIALEHHLVSRLTSLVAVEDTRSRPEGERLSRADVPLNLPAGWDFDKVFGKVRLPADNRADTGGDTPTLQDAAFAQEFQMPASAIAAAPRTAAQSLAKPAGSTVPYPATATDAQVRLTIGLALLMLSLLLVAARRFGWVRS